MDHDPPRHASPFKGSPKSMAFLTGAKTVALERQWRVPDHSACLQPGVPATELLVARTSFFEYIEALLYHGGNQAYNSSGAHWYIQQYGREKVTSRLSNQVRLILSFPISATMFSHQPSTRMSSVSSNHILEMASSAGGMFYR